MKKTIGIFTFILLVSGLLLTGCGKTDNPPTPAPGKAILKVGATAVPHAEILQIVKPILAKDNIDLQIVEMSDYVTPNMALNDKSIDANFFQHIPYLEKFSKERNLKLTYTAKVHIEPMGVYSQKIKSLNEVPSGATIAIPNDPTNGGRALLLLQTAGLIKLKPGAGITATPLDIVDNPKKLSIKELEAPQLPRVLADVAFAVINTNYALEAKLVPTKDALFIETKDSPYVNILTIRSGEENRPELQKLAQALTSPEVKKFLEDKYKGSIVPAF